jgi:hypothetical protein
LLVVGKERNNLVHWALVTASSHSNALVMPTRKCIGLVLVPVKAGTGASEAAKVVKKPCMCCAIGGKEMAKPNTKLCKSWCQHWKAEGKLDQYRLSSNAQMNCQDLRGCQQDPSRALKSE